jgi:hypothetical protein
MEDRVRKGISGIVAVLIGLLCWTGCGGGSSTISKAEYLQQLELVCNKGLQAREEFTIKANQKAAQSKQSSAAVAKSIREFAGVYEGTTEEIAEIGLPEQGKKQAEELVHARELGVAKVKKDPVGALSNAVTIFAKPNKIAENFGVASCAK